MKGIILLFLLLIAIPSASAYEGIFAILNENYTQNASELPASGALSPTKNIQQSGHIEGWIDIVGFKNTVRDGDNYYTQGNPQDSAIIQYDAWAELSSNVRGLERYVCYWCAVDSLSKAVSTRIDGNNTIATLTVILKWHETLESESGTQTIYYTESATFTDSELPPLQYPALKEPQVIITQYSNSLYENIGVRILNDDYTKTTFDYKDKHAARTFKILHAESNSGIVYGNVTELEQWKIEGTNISRYYNEILLDGNLSKMDLNEFDVRAYDAFGSVKANPGNFTIRREEFAPGKSFTALFFGFIGVVGVLFYSTQFLLRKATRWQIKLF